MMKRITTLGLALGCRVCLGRHRRRRRSSSAVGGPITGPSAATGAQMKNGVDQAAEDINTTGGILGQKITVSYGDDVSDPKQGVSVANKFAADGVKFVIGHYNSGVTMPSSEVYQENGILQITPASTNPQVTERNMWNIFRDLRPRRSAGQGRRRLHPQALQGQEDRRRPRQDDLRQGPRRRDAQDDQQRRHEGRAVRRHQHRREGLSPRWSRRSSSRAPTWSIGAASTPKAA